MFATMASSDHTNNNSNSLRTHHGYNMTSPILFSFSADDDNGHNVYIVHRIVNILSPKEIVVHNVQDQVSWVRSIG